MKKLIIPYKITRASQPGNHILIKGRMLGFHAIAPVLFLSVAITFLPLLHPAYWPAYTAICLVLLLIQPFICRFKIELTPSFVTIRIKYLGITTEQVDVPFHKVVINANGFRDINKVHYDDYHRHPESYLAIEFDNGWDGPVDYITLCFNGKDLVFSAEMGKFEAELWSTLTNALREINSIRE